MPILTRIQGIMREAAGWPETMAMATMAVAEPRLDAGAGLQCARGGFNELGGFHGPREACWWHRVERRGSSQES